MILLNAFTDTIVAYFGSIPAQWTDFTTHFLAYLPIIGLLILIESLLSVDNAAVLATMVIDLPAAQRAKALKYGIFGAYFFRGICLILAGFLVSVWWLKPIGGLYLLYLVYEWWKGKQTSGEEDDYVDKNANWFYRATIGTLGNFWSTVVLVEIMDLAFSIDNVFAAVAYTPNIIAIWIGVFIGILAMRFVAQGFVKLMERYAFLEICAFVVIGILGLKLGSSLFTHFYPCSGFAKFMEGENACKESLGLPVAHGHHELVAGDLLTTFLTLGIFFIPVITSLLFNYPRRGKREEPAA
jgi:YkoY family integral membrane protein